MLNGKILISTIFMSVLVYASVAAPNKCSSNARFDANKLAGYWNYLVQVSLWPDSGRCGHLYLKNESDGEFSGYWFGIDNQRTINLTLVARVVDRTFQLAFEYSYGFSKPVSLQMKTCDGYSEFALEDESHNWYYIFGKNKTPSKEILAKYKLLADTKNLNLITTNNDNCPDVTKANHS